MNYEFPHIKHLNDVLPAIEGREEFIVAQREWGTVVNYMVAMADTFPQVNDRFDAIRRECRGIMFYPDGQIMSRRLHKFFNVNERDETAAHQIDLSKTHVILEKLDGSMITPVVMSRVADERFPGADVTCVEHMRWGTKMGVTDVAMGAEEFVAKNPGYEEFARWCIDYVGATPIFEWCSRRQRIVVDYPEDRLVLIAVRDTVSGRYESLDWMRHYASKYGVEVVKTYPGTTSSMEHLIAETRATEGAEGWIIRFNDGQMVKVKGDWYVRIHRTKDALVHEKNVVEMLVNEKADDVKAFMLDEDRKRLEAFETEFWIGIADTVRRYENYFKSMQLIGMDRKTWALEHMPTIQRQNPFTPNIVFGMFDGKDVRTMVLDTIRKNIGTHTKVDAVRLLWADAKWNYQFDGGA